jgi:hypothetical protein
MPYFPETLRSKHPEQKTPTLIDPRFSVEDPGGNLLSRAQTAHYHRRRPISRPVRDGNPSSKLWAADRVKRVVEIETAARSSAGLVRLPHQQGYGTDEGIAPAIPIHFRGGLPDSVNSL